jgi:hypothetical protein
MIGYVFYASDYNKIWCSVQKQTHVVVLCKTSTSSIDIRLLFCFDPFSHGIRARNASKWTNGLSPLSPQVGGGVPIIVEWSDIQGLNQHASWLVPQHHHLLILR